jgi:hypothetical protein
VSVPARGYSWPPFQPGNEAAVQHGAYRSVLALQERAQTITDRLLELLGDDFDPKFTPALEAASIAATRLEKATTALDAATDDEYVLKLSADARGWFRELVRVLEACGLTPEHSTPAVSVQVAAITVEQDAATQARLYAKLRQLGLVRDVAGELAAGDVIDAEEEAPELEGVPSSVRHDTESRSTEKGQ